MRADLREPVRAGPVETRPAPAAAVLGVLPFVLVVVPFAVISARVVLGSHALFFFGDQALIDIGAGEAVRGHQLLGVYSRFGWNHPGPVWLFLLGVGRFIGGGGAVSLIVANLAVNAGFAVLIVAAARRLAGRLGAWTACLSVLALVQTFGLVDRFLVVWNPWAVVLPFLLFLVLCVLVADDRRPLGPPLVAALLCGTFLVQTHLGTAPVAGVVLAGGLALRALQPRFPKTWGARLGPADPPRQARGPRAPRTTALLALGIGAIVLAWIPPVTQQFTHDPGNLGRLLTYARSEKTGTRPGVALRAVGNELAAFPFRKDERHPFGESDTGSYGKAPYAVVFVGPLYLLVAMGLALWGIARGRRLAVLTGLVGAGGIAATIVSAIATPGPLYPYLVGWAMIFPPFLLLGVALALDGGPPVTGLVTGEGARRWLRSPLAAVVGLTLLWCAVDTVQTTRNPLVGLDAFRASPVWGAVEPALRANPGRVLLDISDIDAVPVAAIVADHLYGSGRGYSVSDNVAFVFGDRSVITGREAVRLVFVSSRHPDETVPGYTLVGDVAGTRIWVPGSAAG